MPTAPTKKRDLVGDYFNQPIFYGGLICTRIEAIRDMREQGLSEPCIDRWMMGAELAPEPAVLLVDEGDNCVAWGPIGVTPAARGEGKNESIAHYFEAARS